MKTALAGTSFILLLCSAMSHAVESDHFQLRNTADLVKLCTVDPNHQHAETAMSFCHGFLVGAWNYHVATVKVSGAEFVCIPEPKPPRSQVMDAFSAWAKQNTQFMNEPAADGLFRYLGQSYPCQK